MPFRSGRPLSLTEFVLIMGLLTAMTALAVDAVLPALGDMSRSLHITDGNDRQLVISLLFGGMAFGQIVYGPLSDSIGRKPAIYLGIVLYGIGCILSLASSDLTTMLAGRFLQGFGAAGPRIVGVALIRDRFKGREMARVMSFIMSVFIFVPAVAPAFGEGLLFFWGWHAIFAAFLAIALTALVWFGVRVEETLPPEARVPFSLRHITRGAVAACRNRTAFAYTVTTGIIFGAFLGYLSSAQQIFQESYRTGEAFVLYFGLFALAIGLASFVNARLVMRLGMRRISGLALFALTALSLLFWPVVYACDGLPPFAAFLGYGLSVFFCIGLLFGNLNAMAMEPLGHIAGIGAAVVGSLSTFISVPLGIMIGRFYDGGILPLVTGFALLGALAGAVFRYAEGAPMRDADAGDSPA